MPAFVRQDAMPSLAPILRATTHARARARQSIAAVATCHSLRIFASHVPVADSSGYHSLSMASSSGAAAAARTVALVPPSPVSSLSKAITSPASSSASSYTSSSAITTSSITCPTSPVQPFTGRRHERGVPAHCLSSSPSFFLSSKSSSSLLTVGSQAKSGGGTRLAEGWGREVELCTNERYSASANRESGNGEEVVDSGGRRKRCKGRCSGASGLPERIASGYGSGKGVVYGILRGGVSPILRARGRLNGTGPGGGGRCLCEDRDVLSISARRPAGRQGKGEVRRREDGAAAAPFAFFKRSFAFHFFNPSFSSPSDVYFRAIYESSISRDGRFEAGALQLDENHGEDLLQTVDGDREEEEDEEVVAVGESDVGSEHRSGVGSDRGSLRLYSGAVSLPHPEKAEKGGEDAHFISCDEHAVGVADGVGGWAEVGIDAGQYARQLMCNSVQALRQEPPGLADPLRVLAKAHERTKVQGSSTACILLLRDDVLQAANLGDSGFILIRKGRTVFKSPPQQHSFNFPYQLGSSGSDLPESAEVYGIAVVPGDVIIVGTDGLFDNVYDSELATVVMHSINSGWGPQDTAQRIGAIARLRAQDKHRQTPFARAAQEAGYRFQGGKMDDITVIVSYVTEKEKAGPTQYREMKDTSDSSDVDSDNGMSG